MARHGLWRNGVIAVVVIFVIQVIARESIKSIIGDPARVGWVAFAKAGGIALAAGMLFAAVIATCQFFYRCPSISAFTRYHARYLKPLSLLILHSLLWLGLLAATVAAVGCYTREPIAWGVFAIMTLPACILAALTFRQSAAHGRINQAPLESILLDHALDGSIESGVDGDIADHDERLIAELLTLKDQDFICISAVHFSSLLSDEVKLKTLKANNPTAEFYYMPHFPFSLDILVRAQELGHNHREDYLGPAAKSACLCKKLLHGKVRFRHETVYLRLVIWGKLDVAAGAARPQPLGSADMDQILKSIGNGGFRVQRYIRGHDGAHSPLLYGNFAEWCGMYKYLIRWFLLEWRNQTVPASLREILANDEMARKLADRMGLRKRASASKCLESHKAIAHFFRTIDNGGVI